MIIRSVIHLVVVATACRGWLASTAINTNQQSFQHQLVQTCSNNHPSNMRTAGIGAGSFAPIGRWSAHSESRRRHGNRRKVSSTTCTAHPLKDATSDNNHSDIRRNIFHENYNKPIVLLGMSSSPSSQLDLTNGDSGKELERLAQSWIATATHHQGKIMHLISSSGQKNVENVNHVIQQVTSKQWRWPDVLVMDCCSQAQQWCDEDMDQQIQVMADMLYNQLEMLIIHVNVQPSNANERDSLQRQKLEESVFVKCSDYEICIRDEGLISLKDKDNDQDNDQDHDEWDHIEWELRRIVARARLVPAIPGDTKRSSNTASLTMGKNTFFLSLSFPNIRQVERYVEELCQVVDAMEYRVDLLDCCDSRFEILYGMQLLRKYCRPHASRSPALFMTGLDLVLEDIMPIVYTVRTQNQAGKYPDDIKGIQNMFNILHWGLRGGVEVLDVESAWDPTQTASLLDMAERRYSSQILGSHHVVGKEISTEEAVGLFEQCALDGRAHGAKVVLSINSDEKDRMAYEAALIAAELAAEEGRPVIPNISLILGDIGRFSRIINLPFTPVTHDSLPVKAAPGQLTASEIMLLRILTKIFTYKQYCILGHNIAYSISPQMHGAAFAATKLPHDYGRVDVATVEEFVKSDLFQSGGFGGASVTIPHKQTIIPYVDTLSEAAERIGSVNTLIVREEFIDDDFKRVIHGDNTDWRGIFNPLDRQLSGTVSSNDCALILGAGGTARAAAYVATKLGMRRIYYNRTPAKAQELVDVFGGDLLSSLDESSEAEASLGSYLERSPDSQVRVVISTLPASANFLLPTWLYHDKPGKPIVFDVNYKPYSTPLLLQAEANGCSVVRGSEMLWEQGVGQFELWMERTAPYSVMKEVVLRNCLETAPKAVDHQQEPRPPNKVVEAKTN